MTIANKGAAAQDRVRGGADHGPDVDSVDRRRHTFHFDQAIDQLLWALRGSEELRR